jgi:hypothetical protein
MTKQLRSSNVEGLSPSISAFSTFVIPSSFVIRHSSFRKVTLFADAIRFGEPCRDFSIDLLDALEPKRVKVISGRKSFDASESWVFEPPRENDVTVHPVSSDRKRGKTHSHLKRDTSFLRQDDDGSVLLRQRQQLVEDRAHGFRLAGEM